MPFLCAEQAGRRAAEERGDSNASSMEVFVLNAPRLKQSAACLKDESVLISSLGLKGFVAAEFKLPPVEVCISVDETYEALSYSSCRYACTSAAIALRCSSSPN